MMFKGIRAAEIPYDDGSGYKADLTLDGALCIHIQQGKDVVVLAPSEWKQVRAVIDKMYAAAGKMLAAPAVSNGARGGATE
jgi:hypothetical protein